MAEVKEAEEEETVCQDRDGDGFLDRACGGDDCDDSNPEIFPGAEEICGDNIDNDCDGLVDEPYFVLNNIPLNDETHYHTRWTVDYTAMFPLSGRVASLQLHGLRSWAPGTYTSIA